MPRTRHYLAMEGLKGGTFGPEFFLHPRGFAMKLLSPLPTETKYVRIP
jgi:hypothetical protein